MDRLMNVVAVLSGLLIVLVLLSIRRAHIRVEYSGSWLAAGVLARTLAAAAVTLLTVTYLSVALVTRTGSPWAGLMALPVGLAYDLILLHISMWKYEFSVVDWKGRNVCIPAMHVIPHLPKL